MARGIIGTVIIAKVTMPNLMRGIVRVALCFNGVHLRLAFERLLAAVG